MSTVPLPGLLGLLQMVTSLCVMMSCYVIAYRIGRKSMGHVVLGTEPFGSEYNRIRLASYQYMATQYLGQNKSFTHPGNCSRQFDFVARKREQTWCFN